MPLRFFVASVLAALGSGDTPDTAAQYLAEVKPVLERRCYACHGALEQKAKLRLDTAASIRRGGDSGSAIEPGRAAESLLVDKISDSDPTLRMPPEGAPLTAAEIASIRTWIDAGALAPTTEAPQADPASHWAFVPPIRSATPKPSTTSRNPIDAYLDHEQARRQIPQAPPALRDTLLRRASLDLTGLAPTRAELHAFRDDARPDAYERTIDRLLASPRFAQRWTRHWMDVWRYSDWYGWQAEVRASQPHIWRWRDWIIDSLDDDKPYDQMVREMIAGDELAPEDPATLRATGYLARSWHKFNRSVWLHDTVDHMAKAFLALTFECAKCHDHKYDPIKQSDYYRLRAYFEPLGLRTDTLPGEPDTKKQGVVRAFDEKLGEKTFPFERGDDRKPVTSQPLDPGLPRLFQASLPSIEVVSLPRETTHPVLNEWYRRDLLARHEQEIANREAELRALSTELVAHDRAEIEAEVRMDPAASASLRSKGQTLRASQAKIRAAWTAAIAARSTVLQKIELALAQAAEPRDPKREDIALQLAKHAERRLAVLEADRAIAEVEHQIAEAREASKPAARIDPFEKKLAMARADRDKAIAEARESKSTVTPIAPAYPANSSGRRLALAGWISNRDNPLTARVLVNHVWMRHMGRPLVESVFDFGHHGTGPSHQELLDHLAVEFMDHGWSLKWLHRTILTSDAYRRASHVAEDHSAIALDPDNRWYWRANDRRLEAELVRDNVLWVASLLDESPGGPDLDENKAMEIPRRSLYFRHAPEKNAEFLKLFDAANPAACYRREVSIIPQQALALANSTISLDSARVLAGRLSAETGENDHAFLIAAFETLLGRAPGSSELETCREYLARMTASLKRDASGWTRFTDGPTPRSSPSANPSQRAREDLVHVLLNHHDFVTIP